MPWIDDINALSLTCVKLGIVLVNFIFARVWFNVAMTSDRLSFPSVEIDKIYSLTLPRWPSLCHRLSRDQPQPRSSSQRQGRQRRETLGKRLIWRDLSHS